MKDLAVTPELLAYAQTSTTPPDPVLGGLLEASRAAVGELAIMLTTPAQGLLLEMLAALARAERAVEVGTFTGAGALCLARGLRPGGTLVCLEHDARWPEVGRPFWRRAGVEDRIDLRIGDAHELVRQLPQGPVLDLAFVDADKPGYADYVDQLLPRLRPGGLLALDNTLRGGAVLDAPQDVDGSTRAMQVLNARLAADPQVEALLLPMADGLTLARRRPVTA